MEKVYTKTLCDKCYKESELETETTYTLQMTINDKRYATVDLCTDHAKAMSIFEIIQDAEDAETDRMHRHKNQCPVCGNWYSIGTGMTMHMKAQHPDEYNAHKVMVTDKNAK